MFGFCGPETALRGVARRAHQLRDLKAREREEVVRPGAVGLGTEEPWAKEVLAAEQQRIEEERAKARRWGAAATHEVRDVMDALDDALALVDAGKLPYRDAQPAVRRMINQGLYERLIVSSPDDVESESPLYDSLIPLARELAAVGAGNRDESRKTPAPFQGAGVRTSFKWRGDRDDVRTLID